MERRVVRRVAIVTLVLGTMLANLLNTEAKQRETDQRTMEGNSRQVELGVIARPMPQSDVFGLAPPLCLTRAEADIIVDVAKKAVDQVAAKHGYA